MREVKNEIRILARNAKMEREEKRTNSWRKSESFPALSEIRIAGEKMSENQHSTLRKRGRAQRCSRRPVRIAKNRNGEIHVVRRIVLGSIVLHEPARSRRA